MVSLRNIVTKFKELVALLKEADPSKKSFVYSNVLEIFMLCDMTGDIGGDLHLEMSDIDYPPAITPKWNKMIHRLDLILCMEKSETEKSDSCVLTNPGAWRRLLFFVNSLSMNMPRAPLVRKMKSFSVFISSSDEEILADLKEKNWEQTNQGEFQYLLERLGCKTAEEVRNSEDNVWQLRQWASSRGSTVWGTVSRVMYYRRALKLQAFLESDIPDTSDIHEMTKEYYDALSMSIADMKFTCILLHQNYLVHKKAGDRRATEILKLMVEFPSLRVAYYDEVEEMRDGKLEKVFYSVLVKPADNDVDLDQEIYRIKLSGPPILGEPKPELQNHAIIFTRGEALQTMNTNQANYLEEALKIRNLLEEFKEEDFGGKKPVILGVREDIFNGRDSSYIALFFSRVESTFVTSSQRILARLLKVRFHYGHPDVFDRIFHITRGGFSKASRDINCCTDNIYAGFNSTLRGGKVTYKDYIQVGKNRDVGMNRISLLEAQAACNVGGQTLSRDIYRLGHGYDLFRLLSLYSSTIGYHITATFLVVALYAYLYGRLYAVLSGNLDKVLEETIVINYTIFTSLMVLPMCIESWYNRFVISTLNETFVVSSLCGLFMVPFVLGTRFHFMCETIRKVTYQNKLHDTAPPKTLGQIYRFYSRSHITKGLELIILVILYLIYGAGGQKSPLFTAFYTSLWLFVCSWILAPFFFDFSIIEWETLLYEWDEWNRWLRKPGGTDMGASTSESWESWWEEQLEYLRYMGFFGRLGEIILALRFIVFHVIFMQHVPNAQLLITYILSLSATVVSMIILVIHSKGMNNIKPQWHHFLRLAKPLAVIAVVALLVGLHAYLRLSVVGYVVAFFIPGWGILQILACLPFCQGGMIWGFVRETSRAYEYLMGTLVFFPVAAFTWNTKVALPNVKLLASFLTTGEKNVQKDHKE